jgi:NosR/NirI family transcriptional regulator, nitrous oxide reductase regulator
VAARAARFAPALLALAFVALAHAGTLTRPELVKWFPAPFSVGDRDKDLPVWPIFRQSGPPAHTLELAGYAFESIDLAPVPGFSGTPVNLLVALDTKGEFIDVAVLSHHEPVFLGGLGEPPLARFLAQYKGLALTQNITIGTGAAKEHRAGATLAYLDGVAKATASVRIINQSVLSSALKVARAKLGFKGGRDPDLIGHVRTDLFEPQGWEALVRSGLVRHLALTNREVESAYAGTEAAGLDDEARARPQAPYCDVWAAMATVPMAGRNLLTAEAWSTLENRTVAGDHVLVVMTRGRCRIVSDDFQRGTAPDRLSLRQGELPVEIRDLDLDSPILRSIGQPSLDGAMAFRAIFQSGLDPAEPMQLVLRVIRKHGVIYPEVFARDFPLTYTVPPAFVVPPAEDQKTWVATWKARKGQIAILVVTLVALAALLASGAGLVTARQPLRWFRPAFLAFTLMFVGWYAQGQLSIVNVVSLVQATAARRSWAFFLYDPMTTIVAVFTIVTLFVWGRGAFCGWLCPFGALQELVALLARLARIPARRLGDVHDARLKRVKYVVLAILLGAAFVPATLGDALMEAEPFKTAITLHFGRSWPFVAYAVATIAIGAVYYKAFCRYLCPLGALLALAGRARRWDWLARRVECGAPCQRCRNRCKYQAIDRGGRIDYAECFQCMDCVAIYNDDAQCAPRILARSGRRWVAVLRPVGSPQFRVVKDST